MTINLTKNPTTQNWVTPDNYPQFETICDMISTRQFADLDPTRPIRVIGTGLNMHCELNRN